MAAEPDNMRLDRKVSASFVSISAAEKSLWHKAMLCFVRWNGWTCLHFLWKESSWKLFSIFFSIQGHSPAGGCLIAMSCDHRVMASGRYTIGLNETLLVSREDL